MTVAILMRLQRDSMRLPPKLQSMVARYIEGVNAGRDAERLFRAGANLLNATFRRAVDGDGDMLDAMIRDRVNAADVAVCAELFSSAADAVQRAHSKQVSR